MAAINLEMTDRIPKTEYISHDEFILKTTGIDTHDVSKKALIWPALAKSLDYDFIWNTCEMPLTRGKVTKMGHAVWSEVDKKNDEIYCPFKTVDEVLDFDPVEEYGIPDKKTMAEYFEKLYNENMHVLYPDCVWPAGRYNTLFSACIRTFGWDMFLSSVPYGYERFDRVLEGFYRIAKAEVDVWAELEIKVYLTHDDIVWTSGAVFHPDWYRKYIFPRYKRLWAPLKEAGTKVLFCSDGNFTEFVDDIAEAGADGFIFEPTTDLGYIVERYGKTKVMIGNIDCRILQFGTKEDIYNEVRRCADLGRDCPGYFFAVGNHIPNGIPLENVEYYFECCDKLGRR